MIDNTTGETWRFSVSEHDGTITRGRAYQLPTDWACDTWSHYWDGDFMVGFYEEYARGRRTLNDNPDSERALNAYTTARDYGADEHEALDTLAERLTGNTLGSFICVNLDRGTDLYVLAWGGDPKREWAREIEALYNGDIWRIEVEEYQPGSGPEGSDWVTCDEYPEEFYGEDKATAAFEREFPLDEFPAELLVGQAGA